MCTDFSVQNIIMIISVMFSKRQITDFTFDRKHLPSYAGISSLCLNLQCYMRETVSFTSRPLYPEEILRDIVWIGW